MRRKPRCSLRQFCARTERDKKANTPRGLVSAIHIKTTCIEPASALRREAGLRKIDLMANSALGGAWNMDALREVLPIDADVDCTPDAKAGAEQFCRPRDAGAAG